MKNKAAFLAIALLTAFVLWILRGLIPFVPATVSLHALVPPTPAPVCTPKSTPQPTQHETSACAPAEHQSQTAPGDSPQEDRIGTLILNNRRYPVRPDVDAQTLKHNIGWLPGSSIPPRPGACVIMGHRNHALRALKDLLPGDSIYFETTEGQAYAFEVTDTQIYKSGDGLTFPVLTQPGLVLVTCYPFYYAGNAPDQFVLTALMT